MNSVRDVNNNIPQQEFLPRQPKKTNTLDNLIVKVAAKIFRALTLADIGVLLSSPPLALGAFVIAGITLSSTAVVVGSCLAAATLISLVALPVLGTTALVLSLLSKPEGFRC